jgi:hypothetical protein
MDPWIFARWVRGTKDWRRIHEAAPRRENKFGILSAAITGYEYWTEDRKPVRAREPWKFIPNDADISGENGWNPKHFWAFVVYNFNEKQIQILEITQTGILSKLEGYVKNEDWGDPREYSPRA